jgi:Fe-S-cluster containining protein
VSAQIDCGTCHGCCHQTVVITPQDGEGWDLDPTASAPTLRRREDGSCVYLDATSVNGCSVYERRPAVCRKFHCGKWFDWIDLDMKIAITMRGSDADREMLASGRRHAQAFAA